MDAARVHPRPVSPHVFLALGRQRCLFHFARPGTQILGARQELQTPRGAWVGGGGGGVARAVAGNSPGAECPFLSVCLCLGLSPGQFKRPIPSAAATRQHQPRPREARQRRGARAGPLGRRRRGSTKVGAPTCPGGLAPPGWEAPGRYRVTMAPALLAPRHPGADLGLHLSPSLPHPSTPASTMTPGGSCLVRIFGDPRPMSCVSALLKSWLPVLNLSRKDPPTLGTCGVAPVPSPPIS